MHAPFSAFESAGASPVTLIEGQGAASVTIPDAHFLFHADFKRAGSDLILTGEDGHKVVVPGYFKHEHLPSLLSPEGGAIGGDVVEALVGPQAPDQYAQAGVPVQTSPLAIGRVASVEGGATAFRNGVQVSLNPGDIVIKGDVIQTSASSAVGVVFSDGTTFNLSANARMVLNEYVYSPGGSANSSLVNLVQGSVTFVAGEVAHTGDMRVGTPVATMGIRGTYVNLTVHADNGALDVSVMAQGDQLTHSVVVYARPTPADIAAGRLVGAQLGVVTNNDGVFSFIPTPNGILVQETGKDATTIQSELVLVQNVSLMKQIGEAILAQQPLPHGAPNGGTQITTTFPTDVSLATLVVNVTPTDTGYQVTEIHTLPAPPAPAGIPAPPIFNPPAAHPPVVALQISDQSSPEDTAWSYQVPAGTFSDADGDILTFTATMADGKPLPSWLTFNSATMTFSGTPPENFNGVLDLKVTAFDGAFLTADTFKLNITPVNDAPVIHTQDCGNIHYWASNTTGNVTPIDHISFSDVDSGGVVSVKFSMDDCHDKLTAGFVSGISLIVIGSGTSEITLEGTIADINAFLYGGNLLWNPAGSSNHESGVLEIKIDDGSGGVTCTTVDISEICTPDFCGSSFNDFSKVNFTNIENVCAGDGCDEIVTSYSHHQGCTTTYDGGTGSDTLHLVFTPDQLAEILADPGMQCELRSYVDDPCGETLDLCGSSWNAKAQGFEHADVNIVSGNGSGIVADLNGLTPGAEFIIGTTGDNIQSGNLTVSNVMVGLEGNDHMAGGTLADVLLGGAGNDILIGGLGNDILSGGTGKDTFQFLETSGGAANFGKDVIVDFEFGQDKLDIHAPGFQDIAALLNTALGHDGDGNAVIALDANNSVTLAGVSEAAVRAHQGDFHLVA